MRYICTKNPDYFKKIGDYNYCRIENIILNDIIAIDCETEGLYPVRGDKIFCIQVADKNNCYIIDLQNYPQLNNEDLVYTFDEILPYIKDKKLVGQNLTFDLQFFFLNNWFPEVVGDTYVGSLILYNGSPPNFKHDLGSIFKREMSIEISKFEQKNISQVKLSQPSTIEYSFIDVERLLELHDVIIKKLIEYSALPTYELHCKFTKVLAYMQICGLPLDEMLWREKMKVDSETSAQKANEIIEYIWDNLPKYRNNQLTLFETVKKIKPQLSSNKQMIPIFKELGINVLIEDKKNKGEKKESIEEDVLKKSNHEFVKLWLEYRKAEHSKTTFGQNILDQLYNGRLYSSFKIILDTGRIASRAGSINFLNFPSAPIVRKCFVSKEGFKMIVADHQAMEGRTTADITQDPVMVDSIINGKDLHAAYARLLNPEIAELSDEVISKQYKHLRQAAKAPRFAFQYGGTSYTVANNLNIPIELAQEYENKFKALHARIYEWGEIELKKVLKQGYVENALGFKLKLPQFEEFTEYEKWFHSRDKNFWSTYRIGKEEAEKVKKAIEHNKKEENKNNKIFYEVEHKIPYELFRESRVKVSGYFSLKSQYFRLVLNNTSQGLAAHQLKAAAIRLVDFIIDNGHTFRARLCNLIHDEVCMEVEDELCEIYKENLGLFMVEEGNKLLPNKVVFMEADANVGLSWYDAK